ncbi:ABC transporter ATP-binding protein [Patescibacteria group bacterium]|nr:ABC transporter ATP-binding protein [Patescibacteria group bacterium]MBU1663410.1 ABC transporter ATP-binding protein [Patescibacteria group bacterium]MBU1933982.1 ABC transporter ATP-binding protein [Patescibacteria group bacterium]
MPSVIKCENINKNFILKNSEIFILKNINLKIYSGEFIIIFGPSGSGKSTLLNIMAGLEIPTSGKIYIRNKDITDLTSEERAYYHRSKIGLVFQSYNLIKDFNVLENIALPQLFAGMDRKTVFHRAKQLLQNFGLAKFSKYRPTELSGGQQQKVAIARALINNPWILLIDEPTGNLDSKSADEVLDIFETLNRQSRRTIVMVTHNPEYVFFAHRVFYVKDGKIENIVVNKAKKSIHEIKEQVFKIFPVEMAEIARTHPGLSEIEIKAKLITNKLLNFYKINDLSQGAHERLEKVILDRIINKKDETEVFKSLDLPFKQGGIGFYKQTAHKLAKKIEELLI